MDENQYVRQIDMNGNVVGRWVTPPGGSGSFGGLTISKGEPIRAFMDVPPPAPRAPNRERINYIKEAYQAGIIDREQFERYVSQEVRSLQGRSSGAIWVDVDEPMPKPKPKPKPKPPRSGRFNNLDWDQ